MLDAAGYKTGNGDGFRETKDGKQLALRFYATTDSTQNQRSPSSSSAGSRTSASR